jgi:glycerophosphoryl diester phosphodiesterase
VILSEYPEAMEQVRKMGMRVTPYTFRASAVTGYPDVRSEMLHYLRTLHVDGVITDNPDQMPR